MECNLCIQKEGKSQLFYWRLPLFLTAKSDISSSFISTEERFSSQRGAVTSGKKMAERLKLKIIKTYKFS